MRKFPLSVPITGIITLVVLISSSNISNIITTDVLGIHPENSSYFKYWNEPRIIVSSGEHYGAVLNLDFDYKSYLEILAGEGLNGTRISSGANVEYQGWFNIKENTWAPDSLRYITPWARSDSAGYYVGGNKFDLKKWDDEYFNRLKSFVSQAEEKDIIVELFFFSAVYDDELWNCNPMNYINNINGIGDVDRTGVYNVLNEKLKEVQKSLVEKIVMELNPYTNIPNKIPPLDIKLTRENTRDIYSLGVTFCI